MVESVLVYIYRIKPTKQFVGCGAVVSGGFIATCRHVWRDAEAAFGDDPEARAEAVFPHARKDGALATSTVSVADLCRPGPDAPEPDLVLLKALEIPQAVLRLEPASEPRFETGAGYAVAGLPGRDATDGAAVQETTIPGIIANTLRGDWRRQFTGTVVQTYWTDRGSSGSPVFLDAGQQLAGIVSLSETGRRSGESALHEAFVVPGTIVRRHLEVLLAVREAARRAHVPAERLREVLVAIGAGDVAPEEIPDRLRRFVEQARARAAEPVPRSNDGADIDAAIGAARVSSRHGDLRGSGGARSGEQRMAARCDRVLYEAL